MCRAHLLTTIIYIDDLVVAVHKQDVLRLEVCVRELVLVQEEHAVDELVGDVPHLLQRVRLVVVVFLQTTTIYHNNSLKRYRGKFDVEV